MRGPNRVSTAASAAAICMPWADSARTVRSGMKKSMGGQVAFYARRDSLEDDSGIVPPQGTAADAVRLLESWNTADGADDDEEGEGTWEDVLRAIDTNRAGYRTLFADRDRQP